MKNRAIESSNFIDKGWGFFGSKYNKEISFLFSKKKKVIKDQTNCWTLGASEEDNVGNYDFIVKGSISTSKNNFKVYGHWIFRLS